jgi:hypothetical protein
VDTTAEAVRDSLARLVILSSSNGSPRSTGVAAGCARCSLPCAVVSQQVREPTGRYRANGMQNSAGTAAVG